MNCPFPVRKFSDCLKQLTVHCACEASLSSKLQFIGCSKKLITTIEEIFLGQWMTEQCNSKSIPIRYMNLDVNFTQKQNTSFFKVSSERSMTSLPGLLSYRMVTSYMFNILGLTLYTIDIVWLTVKTSLRNIMKTLNIHMWKWKQLSNASFKRTLANIKVWRQIHYWTY